MKPGTTETAARPEEQLSPVLQFMRLLWGLDHSLQTASKKMEARLGITGPQRLVVRLVGHFPEISAGQLAALQQVHPSTLTGVLRRLEKRGVLRRRVDPADGRRALLSLTKKGAKLNETKGGTVEEAVERALSDVDERALAGAHRTISSLMEKIGALGEKPQPRRKAGRAKRATA
jgi:DNA-binding MarR family transcriptional regulator